MNFYSVATEKGLCEVKQTRISYNSIAKAKSDYSVFSTSISTITSRHVLDIDRIQAHTFWHIQVAKGIHIISRWCRRFNGLQYKSRIWQHKCDILFYMICPAPVHNVYKNVFVVCLYVWVDECMHADRWRSSVFKLQYACSLHNIGFTFSTKNDSVQALHHHLYLRYWCLLKSMCNIFLCQNTNPRAHGMWPLLLTWFNFNPSMDK